MKVKLIFPSLTKSISKFDENSLLSGSLRRLFNLGETNYTPPLSLLRLGAVTPPNIQVQITDERLDKINFDEEVDIVGITVTTRASSRAYEIASEFRKRDVTVVLGGVHPSILPEEASGHADVVVVGEGEKVWPEILADYERRELQHIYQGRPPSDLDALPFPKRELIREPNKYATTRVISTGRGCPNNCTFCSAGFAVGKRPRVRSVDNVIAELDSTPGKHIVFVDDNFGWNLEYAKKLLKELAKLNVRWIGGVSVSTLEDLEFIDLAAESGCGMLLIGFESIRPQTIIEMNKQNTNDPRRYRELIGRVHERGIMVKGQFIVGFDTDDSNSFDELTNFINETRIEMPTLNTLIPYPGTPIFKQFEGEGRLLHKNWDYYDTAGGYVVYRPKQMTPQELASGYQQVIDEIYSIKSITSRLMGAKTFSVANALSATHYNLQKRRSAALERKGLGGQGRSDCIFNDQE